MCQLNSIYVRDQNVVSKKIGDEHLLVPTKLNASDMQNVYTLNNIGAFIWEQINGKKNIKDIINSVVNEFDLNLGNASKLVIDFIEKSVKIKAITLFS